MAFIDIAKIYIKSGKGGNGAVSFRRELYVPNGGPDGGDGGRGGDIIFKVDPSINTLVSFKNQYKYKATDGGDGKGCRCHGQDGKDLIIYVPNGTLIKDTKTNKIIYDMTGNDTTFTILKGGKGGIGNMHFATSVMQAPRYAKPGGQAQELYITLELKVLADVGLLGFPNVGKSTFISKITNARPEINNYPFTTLTPHLGVCSVDETDFIIADIPGIIEGASNGVGLGLNFLKHIERTKILLQIVDVASIEGRDPLNDINIIMNELKNYSDKIANKRMIIALNKIDSIDKETLELIENEIKEKYKNIEIFKMSCISNIGIDKIKYKLADIIKEIRETETTDETFDSEIDVKDLLNNSAEELTIKNDGYKFIVEGEKINKMLGYTNLDTEKGMNYFQNFLKDEGIIKALKNKGMVEGDTVVVAGIEFEYYD